MSWVYEQSTGLLYDDQDRKVARGYSGHGEGKNNPDLQHVKNVGPLPRGKWAIGPPYQSDSKGPYCLPLAPMEVDLFGRSGFLIHGESRSHPGEASEGCIILPRDVRIKIWESGQHRLLVVANVAHRVGMGDVKMAEKDDAEIL